MLYAYELDRRLRRAGTPVSSLAYDPGSIPETGLGRTAPPLLMALLRTSPMKALSRKMGVTMGQLPFSGEALARVAVDPAFQDASGKYFHSKDGALLEARSSKASYDEAKAGKLWRESEELAHPEVGERPRCLR